jgi:hypothetical protein
MFLGNETFNRVRQANHILDERTAFDIAERS